MDTFWERLNIEVLVTQFVTWLPSLFAAFAVMLAFWVGFRVTRHPVGGVLHAAGMDAALTGMLLGVYRFVLLTFGIIMSLSQLGIQVGAALAGLGVVGLTVGFAAKDTLGNVMAGFLIFWDKPFRVGDWVELGGKYGNVAEITMRTTRVRTRNNTWVIIPNQTVINDIIVNHSSHGETRVEVPVGIAYKEDIGEARRVILEAVRKIDTVISNPAPSVVVNALGASSVDLFVHVWIADAEHEVPTRFSVVEASKVALDAAGIQIPFPHLQLFVDSVDDRVWDRAERMVSAAGRADGRRS